VAHRALSQHGANAAHNKSLIFDNYVRETRIIEGLKAAFKQTLTDAT
jgi:hypothetical protein